MVKLLAGRRRTIFTTGQVAKIACVAPKTVSQWFDSGKLEGYRIPGSQDRRIPRENLVRFFKRNGIPLGELADDDNQVVVFGCSETFRQELQESVGDAYVVGCHNSEFSLGMSFSDSPPCCVVVDMSVGLTLVSRLVKDLRLAREDIVIIGLVDADNRTEVEFDEVFRRPFDLQLFVSRMETLLNRKRG